jgi:NTP pyrophosphatase (non-canonical NTP hydrolase)
MTDKPEQAEIEGQDSSSRDLGEHPCGEQPRPTEGATAALAETKAGTLFFSLREANEHRQLEWARGEKVDLMFRATELGGEVGEVLNVAKKIERERRGWKGSRATVSDLADELGDVVICADLLAMVEDIDLQSAVARKFNATSEKVGMSARLAVAEDLAAQVSSLSARLVESEAREAALREALEPFGDIGDLLASETEGFADDDKLNLVTDDDAGNVAIADVSFGDFRRAALTHKAGS